MTGQAATVADNDLGATLFARNGHVSGGVNSGDTDPVDQSQQAADSIPAGDIAGGITFDHETTAPKDGAGQPTDKEHSRHVEVGIDAADPATVDMAGQRSHIPDSGHLAVRVGGGQPEVANIRAGADHAEQSGVNQPGVVDVQVGDGAPVALKLCREHPSAQVRVEGEATTEWIRHVRADPLAAQEGMPSEAVVPVGVAGVGLAVGVGVEVQVGAQFEACAAAGRAAHADSGVGERGGELRGAVRIVAGHPVLVRRVHVSDAVAVEVPADRVQLRRVADFDQTVVVDVIIAAGGGGAWADAQRTDRDRHIGCGHTRVVPGAGDGVGDARLTAARSVRVVVDRGDRHRLRGAPVCGGEGQRRRGDRRHRRVAAGQIDGDIASGGFAGQLHCVGASVFQNPASAGIVDLVKRQRACRHAHAPSIVVGDHDRHIIRHHVIGACAADVMADARVTVADVVYVVVDRGDRHRLLGLPVGSRERQRLRHRSDRCVRAHRRDGDIVGGLFGQPHRIGRLMFPRAAGVGVVGFGQRQGVARHRHVPVRTDLLDLELETVQQPPTGVQPVHADTARVPTRRHIVHLNPKPVLR